MEKKLYDKFLNLLKKELVPALGCTEPIALAYCSAKSKEILGKEPERVEVLLSGNIIKNVKGVKVPNSGGLKGVEAAVILGINGGDPDKGLEVLESVTQDDIDKTNQMLGLDMVDVHLKEGVPNLFIEVKTFSGDDSASVTLEKVHTNITKIIKNGDVIVSTEKEDEGQEEKDFLNLKDIIHFGMEVKIDDVKEILDRQIEYNMAIGDEGIANRWGAQIGAITMEESYESLKEKAIALAAAGSDARMSGCSMPVVINSGSGNQGMTASIPVIVYGRGKGCSQEKIYRALVISNLVAQLQKKHIGSLSAYCGVVCAAAGSGCGITYLEGGTEEQIGDTVINTIATIGGMVCDGAKPSCAAKIYSALQTAFLAHEMSMKGIRFQSGEGLVFDDADLTVKSLGVVGREGMKSTDIQILNIMIGKEPIC